MEFQREAMLMKAMLDFWNGDFKLLRQLKFWSRMKGLLGDDFTLEQSNILFEKMNEKSDEQKIE